jgi:RNA polymerase sigma-70 factor (ECF subfamily)
MNVRLIRPSSEPPASAPDAAGDLTFDEVYESYFDYVWRCARRLGVAPAQLDDAAQDVFVVVHRRLPEFEGRSSLRTWIFGIVLRVARDYRRTTRRKGALEALGEEQVDPGTGPLDSAMTAEALRTVLAALSRLDDEKREAFVLAELEQMSGPEIAEVLGIPLNTVYSRLRAARLSFEGAIAKLAGGAR